MNISTKPQKGTNDFLPKEMQLREFAKNTILKTYASCGFMHIATPYMESLSILQKSEGGDNLSLMFKILNRGEKLDLAKDDLCENDLSNSALRYDLTVPLTRFYLNNKEKLPKPFKSLQIDSVFRAERPQKGRDRQFTQCDIDIIGDSSENAEIELLKVGAKAIYNLGFKKFTFKINDRKILNSLMDFCKIEKSLQSTTLTTLDKIDKIGFENAAQELAEKLDNSMLAQSFVNIIKDIKQNGISALKAYNVEDSTLCRFANILNATSQVVKNISTEIDVVFDITIIRGQNYYTGTVYELYLDGYSGACGGGGRFDNMIEHFCGEKICACGFSIGFERIYMLLAEMENVVKNKTVAIIYDNDEDFIKASNFADSLKESTYLVKRAKNFSNQLNILKQNSVFEYINLNTGVRKEI